MNKQLEAAAEKYAIDIWGIKSFKDTPTNHLSNSVVIETKEEFITIATSQAAKDYHLSTFFEARKEKSYELQFKTLNEKYKNLEDKHLKMIYENRNQTKEAMELIKELKEKLELAVSVHAAIGIMHDKVSHALNIEGVFNDRVLINQTIEKAEQFLNK